MTGLRDESQNGLREVLQTREASRAGVLKEKALMPLSDSHSDSCGLLLVKPKASSRNGHSFPVIWFNGWLNINSQFTRSDTAGNSEMCPCPGPQSSAIPELTLSPT